MCDVARKGEDLKIIFNDGQELQIQQASLQADGGLLFKTISATEEQLRAMFSDAFATRRMTIEERNATVAEYERTIPDLTR